MADTASDGKRNSTPSLEKEKDLEGKSGIHAEHEHGVHVVPGTEFFDPNAPTDMDIGNIEEDSPYPEVRAAVANTDVTDMPCSTFRAWCIGMVWAIVVPGLNQFFFFKFPSVQISGLVAQLLSYPMGRAWAAFVPDVKILGVRISPGHFTIKEHVLVTIMATVGAGSAYATDIIAVQRVFYHQHWGFMYQWMVVMSTQLIGFSIGGVARRFLVDPPSMIWPVNLINCALFNTLHHQEYAGMGNRGGLSRERFFFYAFLASFFWYWLPGYAFQALSFFSWVTWIAPNNVKVNQMFGYVHGMGMSLITFDWAQIAYIGSPLASPWWAELNVMVGFFFFFWLIVPVLYYTNTWFAQYLTISSRTSYDNHGKTYNVSRILTPENTIDLNAYHTYSPLFLSTTFALAYGLSFAAITATLMHALLYFRKQIWTQARRSLKEQPDIHARLMSHYPQVPSWWYGSLFLTMFTFAIISIEVWPTEMPVWAFILALVISFAYVIPIGMIQAITNQQVGLNVITELIIGYMLPGRPITMMMFKTWGYITMAQALTFTSDFKLGHYMKIPPRPMFWCQVGATIVAGTVQLGVQAWMFSNIKDMCDPLNASGFICPSTQVFGTASIIWGVIGPKLVFSPGQLYAGLTIFFLIGAVLPVGPWLMLKRWPNSWLKYVNFPVIFNGTGLIPPASAVNFVPWGIVGFIFQFVIRRRHFSWWAKYNYVLSAALDSGVAIAAVVIFFALQFPKNNTIGIDTVQAWWGNSVFINNADGRGESLRAIPPEGFGPTHW